MFISVYKLLVIYKNMLNLNYLFIYSTTPDIPREPNSKMIDGEVKSSFTIGKHGEVNNLVNDNDIRVKITSEQTKNNLIKTPSKEINFENDTHVITVEDQLFAKSKRFNKNNGEPTNDTSLKKEFYKCLHENSKEDNNDPDRLFLLSLLPQIKQVPLYKKNQLYIHFLNGIQQSTL